jgi:ABC-2 type transport system permease protein
MAGLNAVPSSLASPEARGQFAAVARLRWCIFVNSLRTLRGRLEVVSWIFVGMGFAAFGLGGAFGLGAASWAIVSRGHVEWLGLPFWAVLLYWQLFPLMATAFTENFDSSNFLRFPLRYRSYFLIRMAYGALDPVNLVASLWLVGIAAGIGAAAPRLLPAALLALTAFAILNLLLARTIFAWLERWLARRRTREILGILFLLIIIGIQFIGPLMGRYGNHGQRRVGPLPPLVAKLLPAERALPPGLAAEAIARAAQGRFGAALGALALQCAWGGVIFWLLDMRLRAQYRGESLSESAGPAASREKTRRASTGWELPGISGPVAAVVEKELRYLSRSGPMLFTLLMPVVVLLIFRLAPANGPRAHSGLAHHAGFAFPAGAAYALLILSNLIYNNFGADARGIQFFFLSPVRFREIVLAKNLAHAAVLALEMGIVWIAACVMFGRPPLGITLATLAGALFGALANFLAGNLMSLYAPKKYDFAVLGRQRAAGTTVLANLGVQIVVIGLAAATLVMATHYDRIWIATLVFLALAAVAFAGYAIVLGRIDGLALARRESLIAELCRA